MVSLRIRKGERVRGSGGGTAWEGVVARAVERQRMQVLCWRDCRNNCFQQLGRRNAGAVEAMAGSKCIEVKRSLEVVAKLANTVAWKSTLE